MGAWPAHCTNLPSHAAAVEGSILHVTTSFDGTAAGVDDAKTAGPDGAEMPCVDVLGYERHAFYDTVSGKRLARVFLPAGVPKPALTWSAKEVALQGAGCDVRLGLEPAGTKP